MKRMLLLAQACACCAFLRAQQPTNPPRVVKSEPKEIKLEEGGTPAVAPVQNAVIWEITGGFDVGPAHPECATAVGTDRDDCTANRVLKGLQSQGTINPDAVAMVVDVSFTVNEYGEVKDIRIQGIADQAFMQKVIVALYAMPRFVYATKGDARSSARCLFHVPAALLVGTGGK
ncbi:MAG: hypothetical protein KA230_12250 [Flavobacteriales bacterium]|nr:hypothetical protein [Flavobacteriales bacterium]